MKSSKLRRYIRTLGLLESHTLKNCKLVIDGHAYFKNSYKNSDCQFVLGADCDKYADYLIKQLSCFKDRGVECLVIFKGSTREDPEQLQEKHQKIIDDRESIIEIIKNDKKHPNYFDPLFVKDVQKQVLDEMEIKYFCCEYDSTEAIVSVAKKYKCPVLTDNIEYCLYGVSCIPLINIALLNSSTLQCIMYDHEEYRSKLGVYDKMPVLLTVLSDSVDAADLRPPLSQNIERDDIRSVKYWVQRNKNPVHTIAELFYNEHKSKEFFELHERIKILYSYSSSNLAVKYFQREKSFGLFKDDKKWFSKGVSSGRIALPYVHIKRKGLLTGSTLVNDVGEPDALKAATEIIAFSHCLLTNTQESILTFIGKKNFVNECTISEITKTFGSEINNRGIFTKHGKLKYKLDMSENPFRCFFKELWPGHFPLILDFKLVPADCWILVITLAYYIHKINRDFIDVAYYVLLSYLLLGPVSKKLDEAKHGIMLSDVKEYEQMYNGLQFLFNKVDLKNNYDTKFLHSLAEFQHCLQHMNYLNRLCGETLSFTDIPCTVYHDSFNATFVYNTFLSMKNKNTLISYLENKFDGTKPLILYKNIVKGFEQYLSGKHH